MNNQSANVRVYKTPLKKLAGFFQDSRDKWKQRSAEKQKRIDAQETKIRDLTKSREHWKQKAKDLEKQLKNQAKQHSPSNDQDSFENNSQRRKSETLQPEILPETVELSCEADPWQAPAAHTYPLMTIQLGIQMVLFALCSLRGAMCCFDLFSQFYPIKSPCWVTIQNWILRFGLYELTKEKEYRNDWIYILDYTIQIGSQKCLLVLGVTLEQLRISGFNLTHQQVQVLKISICSHTDGQTIFQQLEELTAQTGLPVQIISDHGSDIKKGVELFCCEHSTVHYTYDITHKMACLLKHILENDPIWSEFLTACSATKNKIKQTDLAFLSPPPQRTKSIYQNITLLITWAQNILKYKDLGDFKEISPEFCLDQVALSSLEIDGYTEAVQKLEVIKNCHYANQDEFLSAIGQLIDTQNDSSLQTYILNYASIGCNKFTKFFGWIGEYREKIQQYSQMIQPVQVVQVQIKNDGLHQDSVKNYQDSLLKLNIVDPPALQLSSQINDFLERETKTIHKGEALLGTSDIIESIFGKYKLFSEKMPIKGIGKLVLTIPAFTAQITLQKVKKAVEYIHAKDVQDWIGKFVGKSILAKRTTLNHAGDQLCLE